MNIEELRQKISCGEINDDDPLSIIETGTLKNFKGNQLKYEIAHGWNIILSNRCDQEWKAFYLAIFKHIHEQNYSEKEKNDILSGFQIEDIHWDWFKKSYIYHSDEYEWFYLLAEEKPQGACVFYHPKESIIDRKDIFYIEYVAVAPWNRDNPLSNREYKGVGTKIIKCALRYAVNNLGLRPGFCLHALPQAKEYYEKKIGMMNYPERDKSDLAYFEMPRDKSNEMLEVS